MKLPLKSVIFKTDVSHYRNGNTSLTARIWNNLLTSMPNTAVFDGEKRCVVMYDLRKGGPQFDEVHVPFENVAQFVVDYSKIDRTKKKSVAKSV